MSKIVEKYVSGLIAEIKETMANTLSIPEASMHVYDAGHSFRGGVDICVPYKLFGIHILNDGKMLLRFHEEFYSEFPVFDISPIDSYSWKDMLPTIKDFIATGAIPKELCKLYSGSSLGSEFTYQYDDEHRWCMANYFPDIWKAYLKERFYSSDNASIHGQLEELLKQHMETYHFSMDEWSNRYSFKNSDLIRQADELRKTVGESRFNKPFVV